MDQLLPFQRTHRDIIIGKSTFLALLLHHNTIHLILYFPIFQVTPKMRTGSTSFILFFFYINKYGSIFIKDNTGINTTGAH